ncbi:penicillin-binding protein [Pedobacter sp. PACM 27299]|uniref:penicillin-binding protein 2 n=1 Tax=Pedobacter sp. PACM 27299 TaxID=1727164 RepID=UPI0007064B9F|nr:penicillin-binding protein 2 [Pedobacter sp. PACM 27299]ALL07086.1 penicillin-binding protein [Pedobacter sp. PACM 27299]
MNNYSRKSVIQGVMVVCVLVIFFRLLFMQLIDDSYYKAATENVLRKKVLYPNRGNIRYRGGQIMVRNKPVYDIMVIPSKMKNIDTAKFCRLLNINFEQFEHQVNKAKNFSPYKASIFKKEITLEAYSSLQEQLNQFSGFWAERRTIRVYPDSVAAQFLGYVNQVTERDIHYDDRFYRPGDFIGVSGVERFYEQQLRGKRGVKNVMVDAFNRPKGEFKDGEYDTVSTAGQDLVSSLDQGIQKLAEKFMNNKIGSIVAIEPSTGEVLAFVSSPSYDPNLMSGLEKGNNYMELLNNSNHPLFIRPIQAQYPPGSVFKVVSALVAQQAGLINEHTVFNCQGGYRYGKKGFMGCTHVHGPINLSQSIQTSCNTYFGYIYSGMIDKQGIGAVDAYDKWRSSIMKFGIGKALGIDLQNEKPGSLPSSAFYTKRFGSHNWTSSYNMSLSIGQGEMGITTMQMANIMAIVANRGFYYRPHLIKGIGTQDLNNPKFKERLSVDVNSEYFEPVIQGMSLAVNNPGGTAYSARINGIEMCGKTGTVQNSHGKNHAAFLAFAPRKNPKIAIAVFVENAGYGSVWAAPIGSMIVEKYLRDSISIQSSIQSRIINGNLLPDS